MKTCSLEVIILDLDTSDYDSSPSLAVICDFFSVVFCMFVFVVIFCVKKTCFILISLIHVRRIARIFL